MDRTDVPFTVPGPWTKIFGMDISLLRTDRRIWMDGPDGPRIAQDAIITPPPVLFQDKEWTRLSFLETRPFQQIGPSIPKLARLDISRATAREPSVCTSPLHCACGCGRTRTAAGGCPSRRECQLPRSVTAHWVDPRYADLWLADDKRVFLEAGVIVSTDGSRFHIPGGRAWLEAKVREVDPNAQSTDEALGEAERAVSTVELARLEKAAEEEPGRFSADVEDPDDVEAAKREQEAFTRDAEPEPIGPVSVVRPGAAPCNAPLYYYAALIVASESWARYHANHPE